MAPDTALSPERALVRLRQLAREEREAVRSGSVEALCRIAGLLPAAMAPLELSGVPDTTEARATVAEAREAHATAEAFLTERMAQVSERLRRCTSGRRMTGAYAHRKAAVRRVNGES